LAYRDGPLRDIRAPRIWLAAAAAIVALVAAAALLIASRNEQAKGGLAAGQWGAARVKFDEIAQPVSSGIAAPFRWIGQGVGYVGSYFFAVSENRKLKAELREMQRWRDSAVALKNINGRYERLLRLRTEPPVPMTTARVVADIRGPFANARLADAGALQGVRLGNPVMNDRGVVGRIVGVGRNVSRILLLSDIDSRTPVLVDRTNARAILTGDGGAIPRLEYIRGQNPVKEGDLILTSGDGGMYPRGLPVGVAARDGRGGWRVRLYADLANIDFVRILVFDDFSQAVDPASLAPGAAPVLSPEERAEVAAANAASVQAQVQQQVKDQVEVQMKAWIQQQEAAAAAAAQAKAAAEAAAQAQAAAQVPLQPQGGQPAPQVAAPPGALAPRPGAAPVPVPAAPRPAPGAGATRPPVPATSGARPAAGAPATTAPRPAATTPAARPAARPRSPGQPPEVTVIRPPVQFGDPDAAFLAGAGGGGR
jgi:rod shape-determining protein MreC